MDYGLLERLRQIIHEESRFLGWHSMAAAMLADAVIKRLQEDPPTRPPVEVIK